MLKISTLVFFTGGILFASALGCISLRPLSPNIKNTGVANNSLVSSTSPFVPSLSKKNQSETQPKKQPPKTVKKNLTETAVAPISLPRTQPKWGFYTSSFDVQNILALEGVLGKSPDMIAVFVHWGNENQFPAFLAPAIKDRGKTLVIFWEATDYSVKSAEQPRFSYDAILRGEWDDYMETFSADAKNYGAPVILIPFSEMNGNWFPSSGTKNGNSPEKEILAYRHVRDIFANVPNVKFGWAPNNDSVPDTPENRLDRYYPGDAYVDYVGVDGFNFGNPWQTFDEMFSAPLAILSTYDKPMYLFSFASADGAKKPAWIADTFKTQIPKYPNISGWIWFNENKERDWRVNSDQNSLAVFKTILP